MGLKRENLEYKVKSFKAGDKYYFKKGENCHCSYSFACIYCGLEMRKIKKKEQGEDEFFDERNIISKKKKAYDKIDGEVRTI